MKSGIYAIKNILTGDMYIGSSKNIKRRWKRHRYQLNKNIHHSVYLQRAWNKYGKHNFEFIVLALIEDSNELLKHEAQMINDIQPKYNVGAIGGGDNISNHPDNKLIRDKISKTQKEKFHNMTEENRRQISNRVSGSLNPNWKGGVSNPVCNTCKKPISYGHIKCSVCAKLDTNNPFYGKSHTEYSKKLISEKKRGKKPSNTKRIKIDGIIYDSFTDAAKALDISVSLITHHVKRGNPRYKLL